VGQQVGVTSTSANEKLIRMRFIPFPQPVSASEFCVPVPTLIFS
jgi:hypothetical protein